MTPSPQDLSGDRLPDNLESVARVRHRDNGTAVGARQAINWHATGNATVGVADDSVNEEIDVTIGATTNTEEVQDIIGAAVLGGDGLTATYDDGAGTTSLGVNVGTGLEIVSDAVRIAAAAAGDGLTGGGASALAVNTDGSTLETSADAVRIKDLGVSTAKLANLAATVAKIGVGPIVQVVFDDLVGHFNTTSTTFTDVTGLSLSITPRNSTSKFLVLCVLYVSGNAADDTYYNLVRGSTAISQGTGGSSANCTAYARLDDSGAGTSDLYVRPIVMMALDSPASGSAVTYKPQLRTRVGTLYVNRRATDATIGTYSFIAAAEIAA